MFDFDNIRDFNYQLNAGKEDYPWIELKMRDIKSSKYLNVQNELFKLTMMINIDDDLKVEDQTVHNWLKKCIIFPFSNMVDVKYHDEIAICLANNVIKQYNVCAQLNLLCTFHQRFYKNLNDTYTKYGEFVFNNTIKYEFQKVLYKIDEAVYRTFDINANHMSLQKT